MEERRQERSRLGSRTSVQDGKIVVDALALARSTDRYTHSNSEPSLCIPLALSRSVVFLLRLFHIPSRSLQIHPDEPTRCNDRVRKRGEERGKRCGLKEEGENATSKRRNAWKGHTEKRREKEKEKSGKRQRETHERGTHETSSGTTGPLEFPFKTAVSTFLIPMIF